MINNQIILSDIEHIIGNNNLNSKFKNKTVLITGGTGLIASYLITYFLQLNRKYNFNIKIIVNIRNKEKLSKKIGDLTGILIIEKNVEDLIISDIITDNLDFIYHFASSSSPYVIQKNPSKIISANVDGTRAVLNLAKYFDSEVIYSSTREIYGEVINKKSIKESDMGAVNPTLVRSCYPESKRMAENILVSYGYEFDIDYKIIRIAHVYGPGMNIENDGRVMSDFIFDTINNNSIQIHSDGKALRAFCYVSDAIDGIIRITFAKDCNTFNLSNETEEVSILELANKLASLRSPSLDVKILGENVDSSKYLNYQRVGLNVERLIKLGWKPRVGLKQGLRKTIEFFMGGKN